MLASGLYGIQQEMKLTVPATGGNEYAQHERKHLPANLMDATQKMKESDVARSLLGDDFVTHFTATREWEWREFMRAVTDWEIKRYFEIMLIAQLPHKVMIFDEPFSMIDPMEQEQISELLKSAGLL